MSFFDFFGLGCYFGMIIGTEISWFDSGSSFESGNSHLIGLPVIFSSKAFDFEAYKCAWEKPTTGV